MYVWFFYTVEYTNSNNSKEKYERIIARLMQFAFYGLVITALISAQNYNFKCNIHLLHSLLPVCFNIPDYHPYLWFMKYPFYWILMTFLQFIWTWYMGIAIYVFVSIATMTIIFVQCVLRELS